LYVHPLCSSCLWNMNALILPPLLLWMKYGAIIVDNKLKMYKEHVGSAKNLWTTNNIFPLLWNVGGGGLSNARNKEQENNTSSDKSLWVKYLLS
jgi:hypothetical protein